MTDSGWADREEKEMSERRGLWRDIVYLTVAHVDVRTTQKGTVCEILVVQTIPQTFAE